MLSEDLEGLKRTVEDPKDINPLLESAWRYMFQGMREIISGTPIIPSVVARAKAIAAENPDFVRSDQGQIIGIYPEKEVYYGPTAGFDELRDLVAKFWTHAYRLKNRPGLPVSGLNKHHVAIVSGATEGLAIVLRLFASNQKIGIMHLYWSNYQNLIRGAGGTPVVINLFNKEYELDLQSAEKRIKAEGVTSLLINFPANPSGDVLTSEELADLAELARRLNLTIISDEVYNYLRYKDEPESMLAFAPERTVVIGSASKEYLIPGARVGYVIAANRTFTNSWIPKIIRSSSSSPNVLGQRLLIDILREDVKDFEEGRAPRTIVKIKEELSRRRDLLISILKEKGFTLAGRDKDYPGGAISVLAKLPDYIDIDDITFVEKAMALQKFSAIPGSVFGAPRCLRFGYGGMTEEVIQKLPQNLQDVLESLRYGKE